MNTNYTNDFEARYAIYLKLGGEPKEFANIYEVDLAILDIIESGIGGDFKTNHYMDADGRLIVERGEDGRTVISDEHENPIIERLADGTTKIFDAYQGERMTISANGDITFQELTTLGTQVASNTEAIRQIAASGGASTAEAVIFADGESLATKSEKWTEKIRVDIVASGSTYKFMLGSQELNFADLNRMLQETPDFVVFVHDNREHRCVRIELDGSTKFMEFTSPIIEGVNTKAQSFLVTSVNGTQISTVKRTDIINENKTDADATRNNLNALKDNVEQIEKDIEGEEVIVSHDILKVIPKASTNSYVIIEANQYFTLYCIRANKIEITRLDESTGLIRVTTLRNINADELYIGGNYKDYLIKTRTDVVDTYEYENADKFVVTVAIQPSVSASNVKIKVDDTKEFLLSSNDIGEDEIIYEGGLTNRVDDLENESKTLLSNIGNMTSLKTTEKSNLVDAINEVFEGSTSSKDIISLNGGKAELLSELNAISQGKTSSADNDTVANAPINFLFYTDIHNNLENLNRIHELVNEIKTDAKIADVYCAGDNNLAYYSDSDSRCWDDEFISALGNHDTWLKDTDPAEEGDETDYSHRVRSAISCYNKYYSGRVTQWGVQMPTEGGIQKNVCYFYKDYINSTNNSTIRVIVLDCMHDIARSGSQYNWLVNTLEEARTLGYSVICISHYAFNRTEFNIKSNFTNIEYSTTYGTPFNYAVDAFIKNGGDFIMWLLGHRHTDIIAKVAGESDVETDANQLIFTGSTASNVRSGDMVATNGTKSQDCVSFISIDTYTKIVRIHRIGRNLSRYGQIRNNICINYKTLEVIAQS